MKTIQMTIDENLLERVDQATQSLGVARSMFIREALELALRNLTIAELERQHREGYEQYPVVAGEFDVWEAEQAWGDL
jgi:metal-responsive CopG/Arc/MetJ family transcriptional regulator